jgi:hypothetical protein
MRYRCHCRIMVGMAKKAALFALRHAGIGADLMIDLNDSGSTFEEIANYLDRMATSQN